ncbi:LysR family transcriptional regulator, partial [Rhizobium johnstonii]
RLESRKAPTRIAQSNPSRMRSTTRGAGLTEAGAMFRDHAARVCTEIDIAREAILTEGDLRGRFRIAVPLKSGPFHFAPVLAKMAR